MDTIDWRTQLLPDSRQKIVNKIMETLKKHLPFSGPEGINELERIATRFEERIFADAVSQTEYLRQISMKMLTMETESQKAAGSTSSIPAANNGTSMDSSNPPANRSLLLSQGHYHMENVDSRLSIPKAEPGEHTCDWRMYLPPDLRQNNAKKMWITFAKYPSRCRLWKKETKAAICVRSSQSCWK